MEFVIVGLENAGKTTLSRRIGFKKPSDEGPTKGVDIQTFKRNNVRMKIWDLAGQIQYRSEWANYAIGCDAIIFVVDASNRDRDVINKSKLELHRLLDNAFL